MYEASGRIGGRMFTNTTSYWSANQVTEWCGELIDTDHKTIRKLAHRFDLPLDNLLDAQPAGAEDVYHFFGDYYSRDRANQDFLAAFDDIAADAKAAGFPTTFDSSTRTGRALDKMSVYEYIERRIPGRHHSPLGALLDDAYIIEYGADSTEQSALNGARRTPLPASAGRGRPALHQRRPAKAITLRSPSRKGLCFPCSMDSDDGVGRTGARIAGRSMRWRAQ